MCKTIGQVVVPKIVFYNRFSYVAFLRLPTYRMSKGVARAVVDGAATGNVRMWVCRRGGEVLNQQRRELRVGNREEIEENCRSDRHSLLLPVTQSTGP